MSIEINNFLRMANTKSAKAARKSESERLSRERRAKNQLVIAAISEYGIYSDEEVQLIFKVNEMVMSVDGTAEGWGYHLDPLDYVDTSVDIFNMMKAFYFNKMPE